MTFAELNLCPPILRALEAENYENPTPIQAAAIPHVLSGSDLLGCAQTGTGKTAAFAIPILQRLEQQPRPIQPKYPRVLVLSPTRELASQIAASFATYGKNVRFRQTVVFGGVGQNPQVKAMQRGVDVLVATPGRLLDLMQQGHIRLDRLDVFVLDEADRMLDMGFLPALKTIIAKLPEKRQSLFFTATLPPNIAALAGELLREPQRVEVAPPATTAERITQRVMFVERNHKRSLLRTLLRAPETKRVLVFARTKRGANDLARQLSETGVAADAIHGNKSQSAREKALLHFRQGRLRVLVATDLAARGIDVDDVTHVINYDLPDEPESYVHRIGRTARAGAEGIALSFCDSSERSTLRAIERLIRISLPVDVDHPFHSNAAPTEPEPRSRGRRPFRERAFRPGQGAPRRAGQGSTRQGGGGQGAGGQGGGGQGGGGNGKKPGPRGRRRRVIMT